MTTNNALAVAEREILAPADLTRESLVRVLDGILAHDVDAADLYFQWSRHESWLLEDGIVKEGSHGIEQGVGVRAISGEKTGFAFSDDIVLPALAQAAGAAKSIARAGQAKRVPALRSGAPRPLYIAANPLDASKVEFVQAEPTEGAEPTDAMEVRFVYDETALWIGARMDSSRGGAIQAPMSRRRSSSGKPHRLILPSQAVRHGIRCH